MYVMGLDMGTSGSKAVVFDEHFNVIYNAYREYDLSLPGDGLIELDPELVWGKICEAIEEANAATEGKTQAVAISAIGDVILPLDNAGDPIRDAIIDFDPRGKKEIDAFVNRFGVKKFFDISGMPPLFIGSLAKILWIKENEPEIFRNVGRWGTFEDYLVQKLCGKAYVSFSEAARTMLFDIRKKEWSAPIIKEAGIALSQLPEAVKSARKLGKISEDLAKRLGFKGDVEIISGGHDMVCAAIGAGLDEREPNTAVDIAGTIEGVVAALPEPNTSAKMLENNFPCYPGVNGYVTFSVNLTAGCIVKWYRDEIASDDYRRCTQQGINFYEKMLDALDADYPSGMYFIPHFSGSGNPYFNPEAKGVIYGLTLDVNRAGIVRAMIEGLAYELALHTESLEGAGIKLSALRAVGGGAHDDRQIQLKANTTGLSVIKGGVSESSALGAAALAAVGMGMIEDAAEAYQKTEQNEKRFKPNSDANTRFKAAFSQYKELNAVINKFEESHQGERV